MFAKPETWVAVAFVLFIALIFYLKVPAMLAKMLDERGARIAKELDEARKLREEAQAILASFKKKRDGAEAEAQAIVAQAKLDAEEYAAESRQKMNELLERRTRQAEQKIAQAEANAIKEVRGIATDAAIAAAETLVAESVKGAKGDSLVAESIEAVKSRLN